MTDRPLPEEPPPDVDDWTGEPGDPDVAGPGAEFANEPDDSGPRLQGGDERRSGEERHPG
jgi:hypothetical protein